MATLTKVIDKFNKRLGSGTIVLAKDIRADVIDHKTTGSVVLDAVMGGGWPINQWSEIVGEPSHGKTAIVLKTIAANQKLDPEFTTVWVAAEQWVPEYAEMCGVDVSRVYVIHTNIMEQALEAVVEFVGTKEVDCIVIDSFPALISLVEDEKEMDEFAVGSNARLANKFFRKIKTVGKRSLIEYERPFIGLIINQWREKIGVIKGDPKTTPGGRGKDYDYFMKLEVKRKAWIQIGPTNDPVKVGQEIALKVNKNKTAPANPVGFIDFYFRDGGNCGRGEYDFAKEIVAMGILNGMIERKGAYYNYGDRKWQGADRMVDSIREEIDLKEKLEREILELVKSGKASTSEEDASDDED